MSGWMDGWLVQTMEQHTSEFGAAEAKRGKITEVLVKTRLSIVHLGTIGTI